MRITFTRRTLWLFAAAFFMQAPVIAQQKTARKTPPKPVIFAIVNDGKWIEPIATVDRNKLVAPTDEPEGMKVFERSYYKPRSIYAIVFGGAQEGLATVAKSNVGSECGGSSADITVKSLKTKLVSPVFALATNVKLDPEVKSFRRRPTPAERAEIEKLVRSEFRKNGASAVAVKALRYHNLTALDIDNDGIAEFVGSYWIAPKSSERRLLYFISGRTATNSISFEFSQHSVVKADDVMSNDLKDVDAGRGAEILVDVLDYDGDGVKEVFTIGQAFEGNNYYVYKRADGKWSKVFETYAYRCAY